MKKRFYLKVPWIVIICLFVLSTISIKAQSSGCDFMCDTIHSWGYSNTNFLSLSTQTILPNIIDDLGLKFTWRTRKCKDTLEVMIDSIFLLGNAHFLDSLAVYEQNKSTINSYLNIVILTWHPAFVSGGICPNDLQVAIISTAACGVWVRCVYEIEPESRMCDSGFAEPYNDYNINGNQYVDMLRWQSCGEICCRKIYTICRELFPSGFIKKTEIKEVNIQKHPQTPECTLQQQFRHPVTNLIIPCKDGC